jgi:hypothetical protein
VPLRRLEQRPEQPREPHSGEIFQRKSIEEGCIGQFEEIAGARSPRIVDEDIAAPEALLDAGENLLAACKLPQVAAGLSGE